MMRLIAMSGIPFLTVLVSGSAATCEGIAGEAGAAGVAAEAPIPGMKESFPPFVASTSECYEFPLLPFVASTSDCEDPHPPDGPFVASTSDCEDPHPPDTPPLASSKRELRMLARDGGHNVLVAYGIGPTATATSGFFEATTYYEVFPVFVSENNPIEDMDKSQLSSILKGATKTWSTDASASGEPISVFLHGGPRQSKKAMSLFTELGVAKRRLKREAITYEDSYDELLDCASEDPNALVVGLREFPGRTLKPIRIDGFSPTDLRELAQYPLKRRVTLLVREGHEAEALPELAEFYRRVMSNSSSFLSEVSKSATHEPETDPRHR